MNNPQEDILSDIYESPKVASINVGVSVARHFFDWLDCFLLIGLFIALSDPDHKRIGDRVVGTHVVDK